MLLSPFFSKLESKLTSFRLTLLALSSSILLIGAFPGFEFDFLAWIALVPLLSAIAFEKASFVKSLFLGWLFGVVFLSGTCWWLTHAPTVYAGISVALAYSLLFCAAAVAGFYFAIFGGLFSLALKRFGHWGIFSAPFLLTATELLRLWTTGNNWNSIGYSQAFAPFAKYASFGGVFFVGFCVASVNAFLCWYLFFLKKKISLDFSKFHLRNLKNTIESFEWKKGFATEKEDWFLIMRMIIPFILFSVFSYVMIKIPSFIISADEPFSGRLAAHVIVIQPNVPMNRLTRTTWISLRKRQVELAERAIKNPDFSNSARRQAEIDSGANSFRDRKRFYEELFVESFKKGKKIVIFPESPMNFQYDLDPEFRLFISEFAARNNISVLFNSAEPDASGKNSFFNSAVMVNKKGEKIVQYDKIYLLPFGEFVPLPEFLARFVPTMVGRFTPGKEYNLFPFGKAQAGVMICFESHFASLSREYVKNGADVLVEMTNDGYLGNTPVLRQHLANAVFRAIETNRPVLRATNVGITAYIDERGKVLDELDVYKEASIIWKVSKAGETNTVYVKYGDWFAWLCLLISLGLLLLCLQIKTTR